MVTEVVLLVDRIVDVSQGVVLSDCEDGDSEVKSLLGGRPASAMGGSSSRQNSRSDLVSDGRRGGSRFPMPDGGSSTIGGVERGNAIEHRCRGCALTRGG